jgi:two-component system sensor histidine kinase KdpD
MERAQAMDHARHAQLRAETEQMRSGLLSAVSHDLRTPLATITGAASSLRTQREQLSPDAQRGLIDCIEQEAERLSRLVNNLLDITRIESGAIRLNQSVVPLEEIIGSALNRLETALQGRPVHVRIPEDLPPVSADDVLLEQVFVNILDNAARYTPAASPLTIVAARSGQDISVEICDSGPGFAPGEEQRIWEKFYRGSAGVGAGAGLGLAICKAIVMAHGGAIEAVNLPEGGACFRIKLPAAEPLPEPAIGAAVP